MKLSIEHFRDLSEKNIFVCLSNESAKKAVEIASMAASQLGFHLSILEGDKIHNKSDILYHLATAYEFPKYSGDKYENLNWDAASDWLGDLMWITDTWDSQSMGFILLYLNPMILFSNDPVEFATFLDVIGDESQYHIQQGIPFYVIIGPINNRASLLISALKMARHVIYS